MFHFTKNFSGGFFASFSFLFRHQRAQKVDVLTIEIFSDSDSWLLEDLDLIIA